MRNLPVHWSEGMFLRPHHFQAAERFWTEQLAAADQWSQPYSYGLRSIEFSRDAIANHQFQLASVRARLRDGTLVEVGVGDEPDRVDLRDAVSGARLAGADLTSAFAKDARVQVFLAIPKLRLGHSNVGVQRPEHNPRYSAEAQEVQDESSGGNDQEIEFRIPNIEVRLSTQSMAGYEALPIVQIRRSSDEKSAPVVDDEYIPPVLSIDAWPPLHRDIIQAVYDLIGRKIEVLSEQAVNRGVTFASQEPGDLDRIMMLTILNQGYGQLSCLAFASGVHPFTAYTQLCGLVGHLSVLAPARRPPEFPRYDHDNLAYIFKWIKKELEDLLNAVRDYEYEQRFFVGAGRGMQVALEAKWLHSGWNWYVGVKCANITATECRDLLMPGKLDWKMGSSGQVDLLFEKFKPGLQLVTLPQAPRALPVGGGWIYYEVTRGNDAWKDVQATQTLAMRFKKELIRNLDELPGQRNLVVVAGSRDAVLQIALFAVPPQ